MSNANLQANPDDGRTAGDELVAELTVDEDGTTFCTMYPVDASGMELMTAWITAREGSFVASEAVV